MVEAVSASIWNPERPCRAHQRLEPFDLAMENEVARFHSGAMEVQAGIIAFCGAPYVGATNLLRILSEGCTFIVIWQAPATTPIATANLQARS